MSQVLLFNIKGEKRRRIRFLLIKLGIACREVLPEDFGSPLGALTGRDGYPAEAEAAEPFTGEMLVMDGLSVPQLHALVDGLHRVRAAVALKAVVTEHNLGWSPARLHRELLAEHEAMQAGKSTIHNT